jgi:hypothetical protein
MMEKKVRENLAVVREEIPKPLQDFVDERGRPAVFLIVPKHIDLPHVMVLRKCLRDKDFEEIDVVVHTGGGNIHATYLIVALLRAHTKKMTACVPIVAKSAGTLLCIGADKIVLDEIAQLGPLDTQIKADHTGAQSGIEGFGSALNPFKALEHLEKISFASFQNAAYDLFELYNQSGSGISRTESFEHALGFVGTTTGPMFTELEPQKFGVYRRALAVGEEYGKRILTRFHKWPAQRSRETLQKMIHDYPSHDYIIDQNELRDLGFEAEFFPASQLDVLDNLMEYCLSCQRRNESDVRCVEPASAAGVAVETNGSQEMPESDRELGAGS